ncbi:MAG TPA: ABC transporter ATP-binding protein [Terriglobales bacterium]|nr:ABC transporter ATP-binding protein [Terriglobales bacterium]
MSEAAIRIADLGKRYPRSIGASTIAQRLRQVRSAEWFWALRGVNVEIRRGETVGLVGHNGAGKTTLLRILSRVTRPTEGRAEIFGRLGALLEIGAGFHGELTGRENIFLNGALLGLRESQVRARFADIVEFSELSQSIDTPYKWYSSGMRARLGFSIAVHLESDILLIDEALAVGDTAFRKRASERIRQLIRSDRTVILAGHQLTTLTKVCDSAIWLDHGEMRAAGPSAAVIEEYRTATQIGATTVFDE